VTLLRKLKAALRVDPPGRLCRRQYMRRWPRHECNGRPQGSGNIHSTRRADSRLANVMKVVRGWPVSRILSRRPVFRRSPLDDHSSAAPVARAVKLPTRASRADASLRRYPGLRRDRSRARPLFGIAPGGACHAVPVARSAVGSYPTVSPSPLRTGAVSSLWRFPWGCPRRALPGTLASWSPDFPRGLRPAVIQPSARCRG